MANTQAAMLRRGQALAEGGEGTIYAVKSHADLVLKVYHTDGGVSRVERLERIIAGASPSLARCAAWPISAQIVNGETVAVLPRLKGAEPIHQLYDRFSRGRLFPQADWKSLVQAATSAARSFATVHEAGFCIVDVSESNVVVQSNMRAMLVDCDSCVPQDAGMASIAPVRTALWLAPELSGKTATTLRAPDHDNYGLARLIFLLLFEGSDPMTAPPGANPETTAERVFAFSTRKPVRKPLPGEVQMVDLATEVAVMFEEAFAPRLWLGGARPTAANWAEALRRMELGLRRCRVERSHWHVEGKPCPWCRIAGAVRPSSLPPAPAKPAPVPTVKAATVKPVPPKSRQPVGPGRRLAIALILGLLLYIGFRAIAPTPVTQPRPQQSYAPSPATPTRGQWPYGMPVSPRPSPQFNIVMTSEEKLAQLGLMEKRRDFFVTPHLQEALRAYSIARGAPESDDLDSDVWTALLGPPPSVTDRASALLVLARRSIDERKHADALRLISESVRLHRLPEILLDLRRLAIARDDPGLAAQILRAARLSEANPGWRPVAIPSSRRPLPPEAGASSRSGTASPLAPATPDNNQDFDRDFLGERH